MVLPKTLFKYITKELFLYVFACLLAFTGLLLAINLLKFASLIVAKGVALIQIAKVFLALIPTFLEIALPMSMLLGVMLCFARLSGDSEIIVAKASGISISTLLVPVIIVSFITLLMGLAISFIARPWGYNTLDNTLVEIASQSTTANLEPGVFSELGQMTLYSDTLDFSSGKMSKILLDDRRDPLDRKIIVARTGLIASDPITKNLYISLKEGQIHQETAKGYAVTNFEENISIISAEELFGIGHDRKGKPFNTLNISELNEIKHAYQNVLNSIKKNELEKQYPQEIIVVPFGQKIFPQQKNVKEIKKRITRAKLEQGRRLSMPFAGLVLALMGMCLGIQQPRTQKTYGLGFSLMLGIGVFVIYYGVLSVCIAMAENNKISANLALWIPNFLVLLISTVSIYNLNKENWQSLTEGILNFMSDITQNVKQKIILRRL